MTTITTSRIASNSVSTTARDRVADEDSSGRRRCGSRRPRGTTASARSIVCAHLVRTPRSRWCPGAGRCRCATAGLLSSRLRSAYRFGAELDPPDVADARDLPVRSRAHDDVGELVLGGQPAARVDRELERACRRAPAARRARRRRPARSARESRERRRSSSAGARPADPDRARRACCTRRRRTPARCRRRECARARPSRAGGRSSTRYSLS